MDLDSYKDLSLSKTAIIGIEAALKAGTLLKQGFGTHFKIQSKKGVHDLVTEYDHASEKLIIEYIKQFYPDHNFLCEESGSKVGGGELEWIIDPLDGTVNFAHGIPFFSVTLATRYQNEVLFGVVYQPITEELFIAEKGLGSFLNGEKIKVSEVSELKQSFLVTGFPYNYADDPNHCIEHFIDILHIGMPIRRLGSAALDLSYVAAGRCDGFFEVTLAPWDCAAGKLLVELAGGKVTHWNGENLDINAYGSVAATNGRIQNELITILNIRK